MLVNDLFIRIQIKMMIQHCSSNTRFSGQVEEGLNPTAARRQHLGSHQLEAVNLLDLR